MDFDGQEQEHVGGCHHLLALADALPALPAFPAHPPAFIANGQIIRKVKQFINLRFDQKTFASTFIGNVHLYIGGRWRKVDRMEEG